jgi:hypothetical protein
VADIVLVHGIAQEQRSGDDLEITWLPSLAGGLRNARHPEIADRIRREADCPFPGSVTIRMAFYGSLFLTPDHQGLDPGDLTDDQQKIADELALAWLHNATTSSDARDAGEAQRELGALTADLTDAQGPRAMAGRAVAALDHIPWFTKAGLAALSLTNRALTQVTRYLTDETTREHALQQVRAQLSRSPKAVIGHSLGSVVAYEAIRELPGDHPLPLFITLGSPLGLSPVNSRLRQPPGFPPALKRWVNLADRDDVVAARPDLLTLFDKDRPTSALFDSTYAVDNGAEPHRVGFYLTKESCGQALALVLH